MFSATASKMGTPGPSTRASRSTSPSRSKTSCPPAATTWTARSPAGRHWRLMMSEQRVADVVSFGAELAGGAHEPISHTASAIGSRWWRRQPESASGHERGRTRPETREHASRARPRSAAACGGSGTDLAIASTEFKLTYFGSVLGYVWSLMRPLLFFGVLYVVFTLIIHIGKGVPDYPVVSAAGDHPLFTSSRRRPAGGGLRSARESLLRKMRFPRLAIPYPRRHGHDQPGAEPDCGVRVRARDGIEPRLGWLLLPVLCRWCMVLAPGARDGSVGSVRALSRHPADLGRLLQMLYYASPIMYTIQTAEDKQVFGLNFARCSRSTRWERSSPRRARSFCNRAPRRPPRRPAALSGC